MLIFFLYLNGKVKKERKDKGKEGGREGKGSREIYVFERERARGRGFIYIRIYNW